MSPSLSQEIKAAAAPDPADQLLREQLILLTQQLPVAFIAYFILTGLSLVLLWNRVDRLHLIVWAIAVVLITSIRFVMVYRFRRPNLWPPRLWAKLFTVGSTLGGFSWGVTALLFIDPAQPVTIVYVGCVVAGVSGAAIGAISALLPSAYMFMLATIVPFAYKNFSLGDELYTVLGIMALLLIVVNSFMARAVHRTMVASINLRFENTDLVSGLRLERDRAENASRSKTTFLAAVSHDIRQPVQAAGLFASALRSLARRDHTPSSPQALPIVENLILSLTSLSDLLDLLLDISLLDARIITPDMQPTRVQDLFDRLHNEFGTSASHKNLDLRIRPSELSCITDQAWMERILHNLLSNAIRYTEKGGVLLACRKRGDEVVFCVYDTGIGIAPEHQTIIFEEFVQLNNPARDRERGLGLGLSIAARSAQLLKHRLSVRSTPQRGSAFFLNARFAESGGDEMDTLASAAQDDAALTVCVVEDEKAVREALVQMLRINGFDVIAGATVAEVIAIVQSEFRSIDVIVTDYRLAADVTGDVAIADLYIQLGYRPPAIILTGDTSPDRIRQAKSSGHMLLHKPVTADALITSITQVGPHV